MDGFQNYLIRILLLVNFVAVFIVIGVAIERYIRGGKAGIKGRRVGRYDAPGPTLNIEGDTRATVPGGFGAPSHLYRMREVAL